MTASPARPNVCCCRTLTSAHRLLTIGPAVVVIENSSCAKNAKKRRFENEFFRTSSHEDFTWARQEVRSPHCLGFGSSCTQQTESGIMKTTRTKQKAMRPLKENPQSNVPR
mmetsp:Transcript_37990/g.77726  ORF Transcript_37990/g.77726 Transcript_37990/m.77726 type:complete len:111 (+) Transcript_37990:1193-1525(+)